MLLIKPDPIVRNHNPAHRLACDVFESDRNRNHLGDVLTNMLESLADSPP
jgi:hypothetical protein